MHELPTGCSLWAQRKDGPESRRAAVHALQPLSADSAELIPDCVSHIAQHWRGSVHPTAANSAAPAAFGPKLRYPVARCLPQQQSTYAFRRHSQYCRAMTIVPSRERQPAPSKRRITVPRRHVHVPSDGFDCQHLRWRFRLSTKQPRTRRHLRCACSAPSRRA